MGGSRFPEPGSVVLIHRTSAPASGPDTPFVGDFINVPLRVLPLRPDVDGEASFCVDTTPLGGGWQYDEDHLHAWYLNDESQYTNVSPPTIEGACACQLF